MPTAIMAFSRLGPSTATQASAIRVSVKENSTSVPRMSSFSKKPPT